MAVDFNATGTLAFQAQLYLATVAVAIEVAADISVRRSRNSFGTLTWQLNEIVRFETKWAPYACTFLHLSVKHSGCETKWFYCAGPPDTAPCLISAYILYLLHLRTTPSLLLQWPTGG